MAEDDAAADAAAVVTVDVDAAIDDATPLSSISSLKEGLELLKNNLNGSDVRVGIIMARWNADIVQGLYKVSVPRIIALYVVLSTHKLLCCDE